MQKKSSNVSIFIIAVNLLVLVILVSLTAYFLLRPNETENTEDDEVIATIAPTMAELTYNPPSDFNFNLNDFPKIDGSTSNVPLRSFIICKLLNYKCVWQEYSEDETIKERYVDIDTTSANLDILKTKSVNSTTHNAYVKLVNGETDIIFVATLPSDEEKALMVEKNVEFNIQPIALDAFVLIANKTNTVNSIKADDILKVYTGEITNWETLGGKNIKMNAYQREDNSGSQELMKTFVLKGTTPISAPEMVISGMIGLINRISDDEYGIGYSVYYYEQFMVQNKDLKLLAVDGVSPSASTLADKTYPYTSPVYVVTKKNIDKNSPAYNLAYWILTEEGQKAVAESGYVPIIK